MVVECFYGWNRSDLDSTVVKVWDVARVPINKDVNGTESQSLIVYIHFVEDDRRFSFRGILPKELDVLHFNPAPTRTPGFSNSSRGFRTVFSYQELTVSILNSNHTASRLE